MNKVLAIAIIAVRNAVRSRVVMVLAGMLLLVLLITLVLLPSGVGQMKSNG